MLILNVEDDVFKHHDICRAIERGPFRELDIDCARNLEEGMSKIESSLEEGKPYDLIITDMWYPKTPGGPEENSGEELIRRVKEKCWNIPIILCSSVDYSFPGIMGSVHYSKNGDWDLEIVELIKEIPEERESL